MKAECELRCDRVLVGTIHDAIESDRTWYGTIALAEVEAIGPGKARVNEFISFCIDWHRRLAEHREDPPDAEEFEEFGELIRSGRWTVRWPDGREEELFQAPVFLAEGQITWSLEAATSRR